MGENAKILANEPGLGLTITGRDVGLPERVPMVGVPEHRLDSVVAALSKNHSIVLSDKENITVIPKPVTAVDLKIVADYLQKQHEKIQAADPTKKQGQAAFTMGIKRMEQSNERIPDTLPQLKALLTHVAQSPDLTTLKERMNTLHTQFIQHYSTAVQNTIDTGAKAELKTPTNALKDPPQGENVAAI